MSRIGGRSHWIAWPIGLICTAVVGALIWLAAPGVPSAISFVGDTLRAATSAPSAASSDPPVDEPRSAPSDDCRNLYPDRLWSELIWTRDALLSQSFAAPASVDPALVEALAPFIRVSCLWRKPDGATIATTLATVTADAAGVAHAALLSAGFVCSKTDARVHCERVTGSVTEVHDLDAVHWLSSTLSRWHPVDYAEQVAAEALGQ